MAQLCKLHLFLSILSWVAEHVAAVGHAERHEVPARIAEQPASSHVGSDGVVGSLPVAAPRREPSLMRSHSGPVRHVPSNVVASDTNVGLWRDSRHASYTGSTSHNLYSSFVNVQAVVDDPLVKVLNQEVVDLKSKLKDSSQEFEQRKDKNKVPDGVSSPEDVYTNNREYDGEGSDNGKDGNDKEASALEDEESDGERSDNDKDENSNKASLLAEEDSIGDGRTQGFSWRRRRRSRGPTGYRGSTGSSGPEGDLGGKGATGLKGKPGPPGAAGKCSFLEMSDVSVYHPEESPLDHMPAEAPTPVALWQLREDVASLNDEYIKIIDDDELGCDGRGPRGGTGPKGPPGGRGKKGSTGPRGDPGSRGPPGPAGKAAKCSLLEMDDEDEKENEAAQTKSELKRLTSDVGAIRTSLGELAVAAAQKVAGSPGCRGSSGSKGDWGPKGARGGTGARGPPGASGPPGAAGKNGKIPTTTTTTVAATTAAAKSAAPRVVPLRILGTSMVAALATIVSTS